MKEKNKLSSRPILNEFKNNWKVLVEMHAAIQ